MPDYRVYHCSTKELIGYTALYAAAAAAVGWLFFGRLYAGAAFLPGLYWFFRFLTKELAESRRKRLTADFREALNLLSVSLKAGYSVENAFPETARELTMTLGRDNELTQEFLYIAAQLRYQVPAEHLLEDFARRSGSEDIQNFSAVFSAAKRTGGSLPRIVNSAAETISGRIEVEREISASLAAKKMEQRILAVMPCGIILYMRIGSPGFLDVMYDSAAGLIIMGAALAVYAAGVIWGMRIVKIEV